MSKNITVYDQFASELKARENDIVSMLPQGIKRERFINSTLAAIKQNPELLKATPRSLFSAVTKSAQDGLLPDGKEGVITIYKSKTKDGGWEANASWNPMVWGLRKRARELDDMIIRANVVYENDEFEQIEGDEAGIRHIPAKLGQPRGQMIGAYAIFARSLPNGGQEIVHREVMDKDAIEKVRSQSKQQDGLLWTKFVTEGWKKTVVRRGIKSVPCSERLEEIAHRDDDTFSFDAKAAKVLNATTEKTLPPPPVFAGEVIPEEPRTEGAEDSLRGAKPEAVEAQVPLDGEIMEREDPAPEPVKPKPKPVAKKLPPAPVAPKVEEAQAEDETARLLSELELCVTKFVLAKWINANIKTIHSLPAEGRDRVEQEIMLREALLDKTLVSNRGP